MTFSRKLSSGAILLLAIATCFFSQTSALDPETEAVIDKLVTESFMPINKIPGLALSVLNADGDSMVRGYGFSNLEDRVSVTPSTIFPIASVSKNFIGVLVVKVLSEKFPELGEHVLDVPIGQLIPAINYTLIDRFRSESVTFRDLMAHRLCTRSEILGFRIGAYKDKNEFIFRQRYAPEHCSMRTVLTYSNGGIGDASELAAILAGTTMENLLTQLFEDIGMHDTTYLQESVDYEGKVNMTKGYYYNETRIMKHNSELLKRVCIAIGAGGILSTANDMLKYTSFHLRNGKVGDRQIVSEEAMSWLRKSAIPLPFMRWRTAESEALIGDFGYGLGFFIGTFDGYERISHGGNFPPYASYFSFYSALNVGIFTTVNGPGILNPGTDMDILHGQIVNILKNGINAAPKFSFKAMDVPKRKVAVKVPAVNMSELVIPRNLAGVYGNGISGELSIFASSTTDDLYIRYGRWGTGHLRPRSSTLYWADWDTDLTQDDYQFVDFTIPPATFDFSETDKVSIDLGDGNGPIVFIRGETLDKLPQVPWLPGSCGAAI